MKKVPVLALILASFMLLTIVGPALADTTATEAPSTEATVAPETNALYGQVTQVDENTVTLALAALPDAAAATATEAPATDATATEAPATDAAAAPAAAPALALTGETATVTVDDATVITLKGVNGAADTTGTMADITVGSIVTVEQTDNTATTITVEFAAPAEAAAAEAPATDATATEAPATNG
jgi:hypothetical protein